MKTQIKRSILAVLNACDGVPLPESALLSATRIHCRPERPTDSDILDALRDVETLGYAVGVSDDLTKERTWTLSAKGTHKARQSCES
jgi:hypothetical protein